MNGVANHFVREDSKIDGRRISPDAASVVTHQLDLFGCVSLVDLDDGISLPRNAFDRCLTGHEFA